MIQERLKKDTRPDHDRLEELMFVGSIMDGSLSRVQYQGLLTTNYLIHEAYENSLFTLLPPLLAEELGIYHRRKLPALIMDLHELQVELPSAGKMDKKWLVPENEFSVLGALYVLEGATLGGNVIVKRLAVNPHLNHLNLNFYYYRVYGENLVQNWKSFCEVLNRQPDTAYPQILAGAHTMFELIASVQNE
ncbi:biliverdin-producing heme oxygenase [Flavitalea flava]